MANKQIKVGDIFQLETNKGYAYIQYALVPKDKQQDVELIRVYYNLHHSQMVNFSIIQNSFYFYIRFPLQAAYNRKIVDKVGNSPLSPDFEPPKYYRTVNTIRKGWQIVDSETWHRQSFDELTDEQKKLSPWGIWNDTLIIEKLEKGWTLENWV